MSKHANPTLIGIFVLGALTLGVVTTLLLAGGQWFKERRQIIMYFEREAQGLQIGAPVVFLGVTVGTVKRIQLGIDQDSKRFLVPVTVEVDSSTVQTHAGQDVDLQERPTIKELVAHGLRARLRMQSLLTGQLYVDLDFYPNKPANFHATDPETIEIPTIPTTAEELSSKLENFPMDKFLNDLAASSQSISRILTAAAGEELPQHLERTLQHLESLAAKLDGAGTPMVNEIQADLTSLHTTLTAFQAAARQIEGAAAEIRAAANQVAKLATPDSEVSRGVNQATREMAAAARAIQELTGAESPTTQHLNNALQEISRATRALRLLAETLEQQPEAVLRGKRPERPPPTP